MLTVKAFHIIAMVAWFAGLFYLPRLFVYHADTSDEAGHERFCVMERKLYRAIMTPAAVVTIGLGLWMLWEYAWIAYQGFYWLHVKLLLGAGLVIFHIMCGHYVKQFARKQNQRGHVYFRIFNEIPVVFLVAMVWLAIAKPF